MPNRTIIATPEGTDLSEKLLPRHDEALVKAIVRAHRWEEMIETGEASSITDIAKRESLDRGYVGNVVRLTCLAPDITTAILNGKQPDILQLSAIMRTELPYDWNAQRQMLGFGAQQHAA